MRHPVMVAVAAAGISVLTAWQGEDVDIHSKITFSRENPQVCAAAMDRLTREQDRVAGDHSPFWAARDYASKAAKIELAVGKPRADTFVDNGRNVVAEELLQPSANSLAYLTPALTARPPPPSRCPWSAVTPP